MSVTYSLPKRLVCEGLGTLLLIAIVVGSGIMAQNLFPDQSGLALLANAIATGAGLYVLIELFAHVSGAHFNPVVSCAFFINKQLSGTDLRAYVVVQFVGGLLGVVLAHLMFDLEVFQLSQHARTGVGQWISEVTATFGLVIVILMVAKHNPYKVATSVALYITAAYWFTASTSFANPAVTLARAFTDTFAGIELIHVTAFVAAQIVGASMAVQFFKWLEAEVIRKTP